MFVVAGKTQLSREALRKLGTQAKGCRTLEDFAEKQGVYHYFHFLGFTPNPETILASSDVLIKPTREDNPWGRDILEGMAWGKPVIALGTYNKFVENNMTGFLYSEWDPGLVCAGIHKLIDNPGLVTRMGAEGRNRVSKFCDGRRSARMVENIWGNYNMSE